ncbi:basic proline-rich protein-like [Passer domesticus]|uniref:basic proline-rich protein-like n=1 Tax=Passer domesticus TaxID=48849 RepID=UPI0030FF001B
MIFEPSPARGGEGRARPYLGGGGAPPKNRPKKNKPQKAPKIPKKAQKSPKKAQIPHGGAGGRCCSWGGSWGGSRGGSPKAGGARGGAGGGPESPPELEEEVSIVQRSDPSPPHCFSRTLHDLSCFWDSPGDPDPNRYRLQFRLEQDPWQECPLSAAPLSPARGSRFWCSLPPAATVTFVPLELRVLPATPGTPPETTQRPPETTQRPPTSPATTPETTGTTRSPPKTAERPPETTETTLSPPKIAETAETTPSPPETTRTPESPPKTTGRPPLKPPRPPGPPPSPLPCSRGRSSSTKSCCRGPPQNVSVSAGGARGELCVRWAPPPRALPALQPGLRAGPEPPRGDPPKRWGSRRGGASSGSGGSGPAPRTRCAPAPGPTGSATGGSGAPGPPPGSATTPPELDAVTLGLSCLLVLLLLGLGALGLLGHRRTLRAKLWPPGAGPRARVRGALQQLRRQLPAVAVPGPGLPARAPLAPLPPPRSWRRRWRRWGEGRRRPRPPPSAPPVGPSPPASFEYTLLLGPGSALLGPAPRPAPYANLDTPPKGEGRAGAGHAPPLRHLLLRGAGDVIAEG